MSFDLDAVLERLRSEGSPQAKCSAWNDLYRNNDILTQWELPQLHVFLKDESDEKVKLFGTERLLAIYGQVIFRSLYPPREHSLRNYIWHRFTGLRHDLRSAVIGICDEVHQKDVAVLVEIGRLLSRQAAPNTDFHSVPLTGWNLDLSRFAALCFIGRRSFFEDNPLYRTEKWQKSEYTLPRFRDHKERFGAPLSAESKVRFHHIEQKRGRYKIKFLPSEEGGIRVDYALVRRAQIPNDTRNVACVFLEGATSLGTVGAGMFAAQYSANWPWPTNLQVNSDLEMLLKVVARVSPEKQPWVVQQCHVMKCYPDLSWDPESDWEPKSDVETPTDLGGGGTGAFTVVIDGNKTVQDVLLNGLPPRMDPKGYDLLRAICARWRETQEATMALADIPQLQNQERGKAIQHLRDHVQKDISPYVTISNERGREIQINVEPDRIFEISIQDFPSEGGEIELQKSFEAHFQGNLMLKSSRHDLLKDYGIILLSDRTGEPTVVRVSRA